jgi:hypothetical protein
MSSEMRKIEFDLLEVRAALKAFALKTKLKITDQIVKSVEPDGAGTGRLKIRFSEGGDSLVLGDKDLSAALLVFCQEKQIPVPKGGKKVLKAEGTKVTLLIKLD